MTDQLEIRIYRPRRRPTGWRRRQTVAQLAAKSFTRRQPQQKGK